MKGFTFNNQHSKDFGIIIRSEPVILPPINLNLTSIPGKSGSYLGNSRMGSRKIKIPFILPFDNSTVYQVKLRKIAEWLYSNEPMKLVFDTEPDKTYYAIFSDGTDIEKSPGYGSGALTFMCPDPFSYGQEITSSITTSADVKGTALAKPIFNIAFSASTSSFEIMHTESGKSLKVIYNFSNYDSLKLDATKRKVEINGGLQMPTLTMQSEWFSLSPGVNHFEITPSVNTNTQLTYQSRYL